MLKLQTMLGRMSLTEGEAPTVIAIDTKVTGLGNDPVSCDPSELAFLQYTSGSTSHPKGVMVSSQNLSDNLRRIHDVFGFDESTRFVNWLPVHHDMGLIGGILAPLAAGCSTVLMSPMEFIQRPIRWLQLMTRYQGTISGAPNFAYEACVKRIPDEHLQGLDLSNWRVAFNGSEPIRAQTFESFASRFEPYGLDPGAIFPCYGLAESTLLVAGKGKNAYQSATFNRDALKEHKAVVAKSGRTLVGCGPPIEDHDVVVVDPESRNRCGKGQVGEIWVSGPSVCGGYWNRADETADTFSAALEGEPEKVFLRTGDLGFMHDGQLHIAGRLKNIVIIRGLNYACEDIEDLSQGSHSAVAGAPCAAFGIDGPTGEQLVVAQEVSKTFLDAFNREEITASIQESIVLNHGVRASDVVLVEPRALPKTTSGKLQRPKARDLYLSGNLPIARRMLVDEEEPGDTRGAQGGA
jgi:acyl-CoA synthetase (AMP-forming)/AMP-acid ligase II